MITWSKKGAFLFRKRDSSVKNINLFFNSALEAVFMSLTSLLKYGKASIKWH